MKKIIFSLILVLLSLATASGVYASDNWWQIQSVDTMKYSRDLAGEKLNDPSFDSEIDFQVKNIKELGATHVAIGTPYDSEFTPFLERWVLAARKYDLKVWFRGNFSGWEGWFGRRKITPEEHTERLGELILDNPDLFEDGDIFSSCPECENGAMGDPRNTGKLTEFRNFLITQKSVADDAFSRIGKDVSAGYFSMNGDVAELVMDPTTTKALGGVVVVDHYVATPRQLVDDIQRYREKSQGQIMLGEFGAPIPDIHGQISLEQQAAWVREALTLLAQEDGVVGVNYWVFMGGSTGLWSENGNSRPVANSLSDFYKPSSFSVKVSDELGRGIKEAKVQVGQNTYSPASNGVIRALKVPGVEEMTVYAKGYKSYTQKIINPENTDQIVLSSERSNLLLRIIKFLRSIFI